VTDLVLQDRGSARWLRLNRPERRNALTVELTGALADAVVSAGSDVGVRAIVLTGSPPVFCAGGDLPALGELAEQGAIAVTDVIYRQFHRLVTALGAAPVPVIAAVNGPALGAGLDLALACDLRYAAASARFASSWISVGLVPGMGGAHQLTRAIGSTRAAEMVLLGKPISSTEAVAWGLVNAVADDAELEARVDDVTAAFAALSPAALSRTTAALRRARTHGFAEELAVLGAAQGALLAGEDFRAATARFR
jgi:2-(1,2-epoxy-1,2-dihydrophenyl)acetyl-CoA isomerase